VRVLVRSTIVLHEFLSNTLFFQFSIFIFCKSILTSSTHLFFGLPFGLEVSGFHLQILVTSLSFGILSTWPNHFSLWDLINLIIFFLFDQFIQLCEDLGELITPLVTRVTMVAVDSHRFKIINNNR
jgi:hypothetical protein